MTWRVRIAKRIKRNGNIVGARIIYFETGVRGKPQEREQMWTRDDVSQSPAAFRTMLIGTGNIGNPQGELRAWLDHFNDQAVTEADL